MMMSVMTTLVQDLFSVDHCCYDFSSDKLDKKCCDEGVVIPQDISDEHTVNKVADTADI